MNPPSLMHNTNLNADTEVVFDTRQVLRLLPSGPRPPQRRHHRRRHQREGRRRIMTPKDRIKACLFSPHCLLILLSLIGFILLILIYYYFSTKNVEGKLKT